MRDTADQLDACKAQSVRDEQTIDDLRTELDRYRAAREVSEAMHADQARQIAELEHDLTRAESALADRLQHDAHTRPTAHTIDRGAAVQVFKRAWEAADARGEAGHRTEAGIDAVAALVHPVDGVLITPEEAQLAIRAARHSAESIRSVAAVDPSRLHPDVAPYAARLDDLADRLTR